MMHALSMNLVWVYLYKVYKTTGSLYLSRLRTPRLECANYGEWLDAKVQD